MIIRLATLQSPATNVDRQFEYNFQRMEWKTAENHVRPMKSEGKDGIREVRQCRMARRGRLTSIRRQPRLPFIGERARGAERSRGRILKQKSLRGAYRRLTVKAWRKEAGWCTALSGSVDEGAERSGEERKGKERGRRRARGEGGRWCWHSRGPLLIVVDN